MGRIAAKKVLMNASSFTSLPDFTYAIDQDTDGQEDRITKYTYNHLGQNTHEYRAKGTDDEVLYAERSYDDIGLLKWIQDARKYRTTFRHDAHNRLSHRFYPYKEITEASDGNDRNEYVYDANGNMVSERKRNGSWLYYTYDNLNRMTLKNKPGSAYDIAYT